MIRRHNMRMFPANSTRRPIVIGRPTVRALALTLLLAAASQEAAAQWAVSADITAARFSGGSRELDGDRSFRPYRPTIVGVGLEREMLGGSVGIRGYYASASLALEGADGVAAVKDALDLHGLAVELSHRIATLGEGRRLVAYGGPIIEVWDLANQSSRTRAGFAGSIGLQIALGRRFSGVIQAGAAVTGSPFSTSDLDVGFEPSPLWRRAVIGRLRCGL
jgi:hypothetical protein